MEMRAKCVKGALPILVTGEVYTVVEKSAHFFDVLTDGKWSGGWDKERFELVTEDADPKNFFVVETEDGRHSRRFETWSQVEKYVGGLEETCVVYSRYAKMTPETKVKVEYV